MPSRRALSLLVCCVLNACSSAGARAAADTRRPSPEPIPQSRRGAAPDSPPSLLGALEERWPAPAATSVCTDPLLRLRFAERVAVGTSGAVRIYAASRPTVAVATLDLGAREFSREIGGRRFRLNPPVLADGTTATIALGSAVLLPNTEYLVSIESGVFVTGDGSPLTGFSGPSAWSFSTGPLPDARRKRWVVAGDGGGDFCSVQGAVDFVPAGNVERVTIEVKNGTYPEIVFISGKHNVTLRGEHRRQTRIAYANNENLQGKVGSKFRSLVGVEDSSGLIVENITLHNLTPQGGSQAEALRVDPGDQVVLRHADFLSLQDTLLLTGRVYVRDSYIEGNVDFVWGKGVAYFERTELKTVGRAGYDVQARNGEGYGYVFVDCTLSSDPGLFGNYLARIEADRFPQSQVAYVDCRMGPHIAAEGWLVTKPADTSRLRFWEYRSVGLDGRPLDVSQRNPVSRQLTDREAKKLRDRGVVLSGWEPEARAPLTRPQQAPTSDQELRTAP